MVTIMQIIENGHDYAAKGSVVYRGQLSHVHRSIGWWFLLEKMEDSRPTLLSWNSHRLKTASKFWHCGLRVYENEFE